MKLSIAIPTLNSSEFIDDCINSVRKISNVDEIIINDDGSNELDYSILESKVEKLISSYNLNISLYRNEKNLGGFKNKYVTISKCTNDYVYQIDSDNIPAKNIESPIILLDRSSQICLSSISPPFKLLVL